MYLKLNTNFVVNLSNLLCYKLYRDLNLFNFNFFLTYKLIFLNEKY